MVPWSVNSSGEAGSLAENYTCTARFDRRQEENGGGTVYHVVWDDALSRRARTHLSTLGFDGLVEYHVGEAVQTLRQTAGTFDLIFNDIDKEGYPSSLPVVTEKLRQGGVLIVDNMFWHGQIFDANDRTEETEGVRRLTALIASDPGWISSIVPHRDGLLVAYRAGR